MSVRALVPAWRVLALALGAAVACAPPAHDDAPRRDPARDDPDVPEDDGSALAARCALPEAQARTAELDEPICVTAVGDVALKLALPPDAPTAIAVFLHGDTANGWLDDFGYEYLIDATRAAGVLLVAALAPNGCSWWRAPDECDWEIEDEDGVNADALAGALDRVRDDFAIDAEAPVRFVGYSGGSTFLTGHFLPLHGDRYFGPLLAHCGGEEPIYPWAWDVDDAALRARLPITFTFGSDDFMREYVEPAVVALDGAGFDVTRTELAGRDHCDADVDWDALTLAGWGLLP